MQPFTVVTLYEIFSSGPKKKPRQTNLQESYYVMYYWGIKMWVKGWWKKKRRKILYLSMYAVAILFIVCLYQKSKTSYTKLCVYIHVERLESWSKNLSL